MKKTKLIYVHVGLSSFVKKDIAILSNNFELIIFHFKLTSKTRLPISFIGQFLFLLRRIWGAKGLVIQFGGYQSYMPTRIAKLFGKKSIIIMGGTDSVSFPSIQYGCFYNKYLRYFTRMSLKRATLLLPVAESIIKCDYTYSEDDFTRQGYLFHAPKTKTQVQTIYNGYDPSKWVFNKEKEENSFITVAADLGTRFGKKLKGIDLIMEIAPVFPDCKFYIVGGDKLNEAVPANVILVENMAHEELPSFIANKRFYLQLSMSEGFPNALCESMLSGCIPIVSNVGAMPFIVGETGYILKKKDPDLLVKHINHALESNSPELSILARNRISEAFPLRNRTDQLTEAIKQHLPN